VGSGWTYDGRMQAAELASRVNAWFRMNARQLPWRAPDYGAWGILVSEFMLQQTQVRRVVPAIEGWLGRWPTPADLASSPPSEAVRAWGRLGYPRRALWLHQAAVEIVQRHGGVVPDRLDALLALRGVGDYTARAVAAFAYGHRHPVVDTNTRRVIARAIIGQAEPGPPAGARDLPVMRSLLPEADDEARLFNAAVMELGALVCTARAPRCGDCPIRDGCAWQTAGRPARTGARRSAQRRFEGSDRQVRGLVMRELRASQLRVPPAQLATIWPDAAQLDRAVESLIADGLATGDRVRGYALPE
jgi:A/G-specific adenine glycosylase